MRPIYIGYNILLALVLFFLNGQLGKLQYGISEPMFEYGKFTFMSNSEQSFTGNFFQKIVNPAVFLAVAAALTQYCLTPDYVESLWLLIPIFWLYRLIYMIWRNIFIFLNLKYEMIAFVLSLALGEGVFFGIIKPLLKEEEQIWIPATALRDALWYAILAYLAKTAWEIMRTSFGEENLYPDDRRREIVMKRYDKFSRKYGKDILAALSNYPQESITTETREQIIRVIYAIMIYEDYNRSFLMRLAEWALKATFFLHRTMSLGIMQVQTDWLISSRESIRLSVPPIVNSFIASQGDPIYDSIFQHNPDQNYTEEVYAIYYILLEEIPVDRDAPISNDSYKI